MPRYKLTVEYDGRGLVGWQRQAKGLSVQEILETAVERFCGKRLTVHGAGRTDAGVHALAQVAHVDLPHEKPPEVIRNALNQHVKPNAVAILAVERVAESFDARRSARGRGYRYRILNRRRSSAAGCGMSARRSTSPPCRRLRACSSANTTSPPFATRCARRNRR